MLQPQATEQPAMQSAQPQAQAEPIMDDEADIIPELEAHLNALPPEYKQQLSQYLMQYPEVVINTLGYVNGEEVRSYFIEVYKANSSPPDAQGAGQQMNPQGPQMAPQSSPQTQQPMMAPQP